jgi:N-acetylglutamate synthase-like GNAT family acetyltransferase
MSEINLPQGYSIRRTAQGIESFFDVYMLAIGLVLIAITLFFAIGFLVLSNELILGLNSSLFLWLFIGHCKHWIEMKKAGKNYRLESWIISFQGDEVGLATIQKMKNYVTLRKLDVKTNHQRKGLGTALVKCVISEADQPIQLLLCKSHLEIFFHRRGFVTVRNNRSGLEMKRSVSGSHFGLDDLEKVRLPEGYKVEVLKGKSKLKSQVFLLKQCWIDSLYLKVISLGWLLFGLWVFSVISDFKGEELNDMDSLFIFVRIQALFLFFVFIIFRFCNFLQNHCLKIYSNRKTLIFAYLFWSIDSAELYVFGKCMPKEQDIKAALIQHVAKVVDVPVYLVCDRQHSDFYTEMGFTPIAKRKLPFLMRILGKSSGIAMRYPVVCE